MPIVALGFESLSITGTAGGFQSIPSGIGDDGLVFVGRLEDADVRIRFDGTAATASVGYLIRAEELVTLRSDAIRAASFIRTGSTSGTLQGHYYVER